MSALALYGPGEWWSDDRDGPAVPGLPCHGEGRPHGDLVAAGRGHGQHRQGHPCQVA